MTSTTGALAPAQAFSQAEKDALYRAIETRRDVRRPVADLGQLVGERAEGGIARRGPLERATRPGEEP